MPTQTTPLGDDVSRVLDEGIRVRAEPASENLGIEERGVQS